MPMVRDVLYWPKHLRERVKHVVQHFQQEELKNNLAKTALRDVIIVCVAEALPIIEKMTLQEFKQKLNKIKGKKRSNLIEDYSIKGK